MSKTNQVHLRTLIVVTLIVVLYTNRENKIQVAVSW